MNGIPAVSKNAVLLNLVCLLLVPVTLLMGCKSSGVKLYDHYAGSKSIVNLYRYSEDRPYVDLSPSQHSPNNRCMYWFFR